MKDEIIFTPFYSSFLRLCQEAGKTPSKVAEEAGISSGAPTAWKKGAVPKPPQRKKLCEYFGVTDNVLLGYESPGDWGGEKQKEKLTIQGEGELDKDTIELTEIWNTSDADERTALLEMARFIRKKRG